MVVVIYGISSRNFVRIDLIKKRFCEELQSIVYDFRVYILFWFSLLRVLRSKFRSKFTPRGLPFFAFTSPILKNFKKSDVGFYRVFYVQNPGFVFFAYRNPGYVSLNFRYELTG